MKIFNNSNPFLGALFLTSPAWRTKNPMVTALLSGISVFFALIHCESREYSFFARLVAGSESLDCELKIMNFRPDGFILKHVEAHHRVCASAGYLFADQLGFCGLREI